MKTLDIIFCIFTIIFWIIILFINTINNGFDLILTLAVTVLILGWSRPIVLFLFDEEED